MRVIIDAGQSAWFAVVNARRLPVVLTIVLVWLGLGLRLGWRPDLPWFLLFGALGTVLAFIDIALHRLPDQLTYGSAVAGLISLGLAAPWMGWERLVHAVVGGAVLALIYGVIWFVSPTRFGLGDVKLAVAVGLLLGWLGLGPFVIGLILIHLVGIGWGLGALAARKARAGVDVPFGPAMVLGALGAVFLCA